MVNVDPELTLIGCCLTDESQLDDATVTGEDFENIQYGRIFDRMLERHQADQGVSQSLLSGEFPDMVSEVWSSTFFIGEMSRVGFYNDAVQERAVRRRLKISATRLAQWADDVNAEELEDKCRAEIDEALSLTSSRVTSMLDDIHGVLAEHRKRAVALPTPWASLNELLNGFVPGRLYIIGARPGIGKSALASQIAYEIAEHGPVLFSSMEMDRGEIYERMIAQQARIYYGGMVKNNMSDYMIAQEREWLALGLRDVRVLDRGTQTAASIRSAARSTARDGLKAVIVDYLHLMSSKSAESENVRLGELTRALKQLAMDLKVPVIVLSQLNRAVVSRGGRPNLSDLRGSGSLEQDANVVLFLHRDEDDDGEPVDDLLHVSVAKNRHGPSQVDTELQWQGEFVRAVEPPMWPNVRRDGVVP